MGIVLLEADGEITRGTFYLLDPNKPGDFKAAGQAAVFKNIEKTKSGIRFTVQLLKGKRRENYEHFLFFSDSFSGTTVRAILNDTPNEIGGVNLIFHRQSSL